MSFKYFFVVLSTESFDHKENQIEKYHFQGSMVPLMISITSETKGKTRKLCRQ